MAKKKPKPPRAPIVVVRPMRENGHVQDEEFEREDFANLRDDYKRNREEFCREYIKDFNGSQAMLRMGSKSQTPWVRASEWLKQPYTQWYLGKLLQKLDDKAIVTRAEILLGLKREAHHFGLDGSAAARIAAWRTIAKILGLEITKVEGSMTLQGGVMTIPLSGSPDEWEQAAAKAQEMLKQKVRE